MTDIAEARPIVGAPDLDDEEQRERWRIHSDREASWALRKMKSAGGELARLRQAASDEIDMIRAWLDAACAGPQRDAAFFEGALIAYRRQLEEQNPELPKTYKVPGGAIARRKARDSIEVEDEQAFVAWCLAEGRLDLVKIEARKQGLSEFQAVHENDEPGGAYLVTEDGEKVPGVVHIQREDQYAAKPE